MKKSYVYIGLLIVLSVVMTGCLGGMRISEDTTGKIVGIVYDGVDKDVTEVALTLGSITIHPDATGEFTFPNVDFGLHELIITVPGIDDSEITLTQTVEVSAPENAVEVYLAGEIELVNPGFEEVTESGNIPGWQSRWDWDYSREYQKVGYMSSSTEQAFDGERTI